MGDIKAVIAKNLTELRQESGMTQLDVAEKLNYSDKAVSKWERGESVPDVAVLKQLADMFGVTLDYLVSEEHEKPKEPESVTDDPKRNRKKIDIMSLSIALVWFIATLVYVILELSTNIVYGHLLSFVYAAPISCIVWLVFNSIWFNRRTNYMIISIMMWSAILGFVATFWVFGINIRLLFMLGIPGQIIIFMWSMMGKRK